MLAIIMTGTYVVNYYRCPLVRKIDKTEVYLNKIKVTGHAVVVSQIGHKFPYQLNTDKLFDKVLGHLEQRLKIFSFRILYLFVSKTMPLSLTIHMAINLIRINR